MQFAVVASVLIFVFYEIPKSKRSVYLLPMYPFLSLAIANLIVWLLQEHRRIFKVYAVTIVVVGVVFSVALIALHAVDLSFLGDSRFVPPACPSVGRVAEDADGRGLSPCIIDAGARCGGNLDASQGIESISMACCRSLGGLLHES